MFEILKNCGLLIALIIVLIFAGAGVLSAKSECNDRGGAFVRGVIGFECVAGAK